MSASVTSAPLHAGTRGSGHAHRVGFLAVVLALASATAVVGGVLWPEPSGGDETYTYADIAHQRELWWALLTGLAICGILGTTLQAIAALYLVRHRGAGWVTVGATLLTLGIIVQGVGAAGWATAYFFPTDPALEPASGHQAFEAVNDSIGYIFAVMITGAVLAILGQITQAVGLIRADVVPVWIPVGLLTSTLTFLIPDNGVIGLITALPMAVSACALGWYAYRRASAEEVRSRPDDSARRSDNPTLA